MPKLDESWDSNKGKPPTADWACCNLFRGNRLS